MSSKSLKKLPMRIVRTIVFAANALCIIAMLVCDWSQCFAPQYHPRISFLGLLFPVFAAAVALFLPVWLVLRPRLLALASLGALLVSGGAVRTYCPLNLSTEPPAEAIHLLTYNLYNKASSPEHPLVRYVMDSGADIVCCQEAMSAGRAEVDDTLARRYPYRHQECVKQTVLACFSRYPIIDVKTVDFVSHSNAAIAYWLDIEGDTVLLVNCHLESYGLNEDERTEYKSLVRNIDDVAYGAEADSSRLVAKSLIRKICEKNAIRGAQADSIAEFVRRAAVPRTIVCGDFNDASISYTHYRLTRELNDAYTRAGNGPGISYNRSGMYFRIDHVLASPLITPHSAWVDNSIDASDHYPLHCCFSLP